MVLGSQDRSLLFLLFAYSIVAQIQTWLTSPPTSATSIVKHQSNLSMRIMEKLIHAHV